MIKLGMIHLGRSQSNICLLWKICKDIEAWWQAGEVPDRGDKRPREPGEGRHGPRGRGDALLQHHGPRQPPLPLPHLVRVRSSWYLMMMTVSIFRSPALPVSVSTLLVGCQADLRGDKLRWPITRPSYQRWSIADSVSPSQNQTFGCGFGFGLI